MFGGKGGIRATHCFAHVAICRTPRYIVRLVISTKNIVRPRCIWASLQGNPKMLSMHDASVYPIA